MKIFLDDRRCRENLYPFTHTRHVSDIRVGILTIREKWELLTGEQTLREMSELNGDELVIDAGIIPTQRNVASILQAAENKSSVSESDVIRILHHPWQIFQFNDWTIREDLTFLINGRVSQPVSASNHCVNAQDIFLEEGSVVENAMLNASMGPIYIGRNALIMEGAMIRGPFAMGERAVVKMGSKIYGATTAGPGCVLGGEVKNSIFFDNSNKAHDGYLGDSVIGSWCNLGAGTSNSNLKNTAGTIQYYTDAKREPISAGHKGGLLMGDYSRCAINTSFNTGTVVGVCCNIFGDKQPQKFVENFSWGPDRYIFAKALKDIDAWKQMKSQQITDKEIQTLQDLYSPNQ